MVKILLVAKHCTTDHTIYSKAWDVVLLRNRGVGAHVRNHFYFHSCKIYNSRTVTRKNQSDNLNAKMPSDARDIKNKCFCTTEAWCDLQQSNILTDYTRRCYQKSTEFKFGTNRNEHIFTISLQVSINKPSVQNGSYYVISSTRHQQTH